LTYIGFMKAKLWIKEKKVKQVHLAKALGVSPSRLSHIVNGRSLASSYQMYLFKKLSDKEVDLEDWFE